MSWGSGAFGGIPWGGGPVGTLDLVAALAVRENVLRISFSNPVFFSGLLDPADASRPEKYSVAVVVGTVGMDGEAVRPVTVVAAALALEDGVTNPDIVDLVLDRPMTPYPAIYEVTATDIFSADLSVSTTGTLQAAAVFKRIEPPQIDQARPVRDFANPQTRSAMLDPLPDPDNPLNLGTIQVDDSGDYAFDEGLTNLKKRVIRRLMTSPGAYAHLPAYGVGIPAQGKKLSTAALQSQLAGEAEAQISREPDVRRVSVTVVNDQAFPNLVRFRIAIVPKTGPAQRFDVPFTTR